VIKPVLDILLDDAPLLALVDQDSILPMKRDQGMPLPGVVLECPLIDPNDTKDTTSKMDVGLVFVHCFAETYQACNLIAETVRTALDGYVGVIGGVYVELIRFKASHDSHFNDNQDVFQISVEFDVMVKRTGSAPVSTIDSTPDSYWGTNSTGTWGLWPLPSSTIADGNYGHINVAGSTWTIIDECVDTDQLAHRSVTNEKLDHMAPGTIKGRSLGGVADAPQDLTPDQQSEILDTATDAFIRTSKRTANNGVASLDAGGKVPIGQIPDAVLGQVEYQGTWNAATNTPAIPVPSTSNKGWYYVANPGVSSAHGYANVPAVDFAVGDWIISNGTAWEKVDNTDAVSSVNGATGAVVLDATDVGADPAGSAAAAIATANAYTDSQIPDSIGDLTSTGSDKQVLFNESGVVGGADRVEIEENTLALVVVDSPSNATANRVKLAGRKISERMMPSWIGPDGPRTIFQPFFGRNKIAYAQANGNSTTVSTIGLTLTGTGTASAISVAVTNIYTQTRKVAYRVTVASATAVAGWRSSSLQFFRGNAAGEGGFHIINRMGFHEGITNAQHRAFCGVRGSVAAPTDVNPSTLTHIIGLGYDSADTNVQLMHNDNLGTATKVDLGADFPKPSADQRDIYEISLFCPPNESWIGWEVENLTTGKTISGIATTDLPVNTQLLAPYAYISVGGVSSVVGCAFVQCYVETDF
jgi:hypothetical protein